MSSDDAPVEMKRCPYCDKRIKATARKCRYCLEYLDDDDDDDDDDRPQRSPTMTERMLIPVGRPISSIAAGYLALIGVIPMCGLPFSLGALVCGIMALMAIKRNPDLSGSGRAWFGIILGGLMTLVSLIALSVFIAQSAQNPRFR